MKTIAFLAFIITANSVVFILAAFSEASLLTYPALIKQNKAIPYVYHTTPTCLSTSDAEKILGQLATQIESTYENKNGVKTFRCTYSATTADTKTNKTGNLYYVLEAFENIEGAKKNYDILLKQNQVLPGLEQLHHMGHAAFLHTDKENFVLIITRKANKLLRLKVNKLTSMTSLTALQAIAKKVSTAL